MQASSRLTCAWAMVALALPFVTLPVQAAEFAQGRKVEHVGAVLSPRERIAPAQDGTVGQRDWPLHAMTAYAIEGNVKAKVPEWQGQHVQIKLEQGAIFDGEQVHYLAGRQTGWHVVR